MNIIQVCNKLWRRVCGKVKYPTAHQVTRQVRNQVLYQVWDQVRDQVEFQRLMKQVSNQVEIPVWKKLLKVFFFSSIRFNRLH